MRFELKRSFGVELARKPEVLFGSEGGGTPPKAQTESCEAARGAGSAGLGLAARGRSAERASAGKAERGSIENRRAVSEIYLELLFFLVEIQKI